ncbi:MAG: hypothetical protein ACOYLG_05690 [Chitinophagaceae bacterium]
MSDNKFNPEKLTILEYKILKGQIDAPEDFTIENVEGHDIENSFDLGFDLENKLVRTELDVKITTKSKVSVSTEAKGHFTLVFIFEVDNLNELAVLNADNLIDLDPNLANALASVTYSTARGILLTRLQGTALQNFILPIVSPNKLLKV